MLYTILSAIQLFSARSPEIFFFYESLPGTLLLVLRLLFGVWFLFSLRDTLRLENTPERRSFYKIFGISFFAWIVYLPIISWILLLENPAYRFKVTEIICLLADISAYIAFIVLLWPSRISNIFTVQGPTPTSLLQKGEETYIANDKEGI